MKTKTSIPCFMNGEMIQFPHSFSILITDFSRKAGRSAYKFREKYARNIKNFETKESIKERREKGC